MLSLLEFFEQSQKDIQQISAIVCGDITARRKWQPVSFGSFGERYYCIVREKIHNLIEYRLLFTAAEYIGIDAREVSLSILDFTDITLRLTGSAEESLTALLQFIICESVAKNRSMLTGSFAREAQNDIFFSVLESLGFLVTDSANLKDYVCKFLRYIKIPFDWALQQLGVRCMPGGRVDYCRLLNNEWGFIGAIKGGVWNGAQVYYYEIRANCGTIRVEAHCKKKGKLMIFYPAIQTVEPVLFERLLYRVLFDCVHSSIKGNISRIECFMENKPHELEMVQPAFSSFNAIPVAKGEDQVFEIIF